VIWRTELKLWTPLWPALGARGSPRVTQLALTSITSRSMGTSRLPSDLVSCRVHGWVCRLVEVLPLWPTGIRDAQLFPPLCLHQLVCSSWCLACYVQHKVVCRTGLDVLSPPPPEPVTTRRAAVNISMAAVCTSDGRCRDDDDYDHHVNSGDACSVC